MMNRIFIAFKLILIFTVTGNSQHYFSKIIPASEDRILLERIIEKSSSYLIPYDYTNGALIGSKLLKTNIESFNEYSFENLDLGASPIVEFEDFIYLIGGNSNSSEEKIILYRLEENCQNETLILDHFTPGDFTVSNAIVGLDELYILNTDILNNDRRMLYFSKVNKNGDILWEKSLNQDMRLSYGWDLKTTSDGSLLIAAGNVYLNKFGRFGQIMKFDRDGNEIWNIEGDEEFFYGNTLTKIIELSNQSIVQMYEIDKWGDIDFFNNGWDEQPTRLKWFSNIGEEIKEKLIVVPRIDKLNFRNLKNGQGDYFFAYGSYIDEPIDEEKSSAIIYKFNHEGDTIWVKRFKHEGFINDSSFSVVDIIEDENRDITVLAQATSSDQDIQIWLFRINEYGCFEETDCEELIISSINNRVTSELNNSIIVKPNPTSGYIIIEINNPLDFSSHELFNSLGEVVVRSNSQSREILINLSNFPNGYYILKSMANDGRINFNRIIKAN